MQRDEWGWVLGVCAAVAMMGTGVRAQDAGAEGEAQETQKTTAQRLADGTLDSVVWEVEGTAPAETVAASPFWNAVPPTMVSARALMTPISCATCVHLNRLSTT